jgi:hypothetical protein
MDDAVTPRRELRKPITLAAQCRTVTGYRDNGFLSDISAEGCCITTRGILFMVGARVLIKPQGMEGLSGIVRWINGHKAGVEFDAPIYGPIVEHLGRLHSNGETVSVGHQ